MRFGINSFLFTSPFTTDSVKLFPKFKKWGFDTVELPIEDPSHIDPDKVRAAADKAGLAIGSICACMGPDAISAAPPRTGHRHDLLQGPD